MLLVLTAKFINQQIEDKNGKIRKNKFSWRLLILVEGLIKFLEMIGYYFKDVWSFADE